ncbi:MAG: SAM-dependent chlorinase/fluorinase [Acidobacteriota bacterium]|nr:SAM-dependent chlorinase/fluorinase [Acidobacteriota bacterium]
MGPILTLTTDFGLRDHYVGTMKGVILSRCPKARIVDISHGVPPFSIWPGAYTIDQAATYFPAGTIHVVVVDPGVGTARRAILVEAIGQRFIAPDNGVLSMILSRDSGAMVREITNRDLFLPALSATFHGRDLFAPVAAWLASGAASSDQVGPVLSTVELLPNVEPVQKSEDGWTGTVLSVDHFGNVVTNFTASRFSLGDFTIEIHGRSIAAARKTFGDSSAGGECFSYNGSSGFIELGINQDSAAAFLGAVPGDRVGLKAKG